MRLRAVLFAAVVLAGAGAGAWKLAEAATDWSRQPPPSRLAHRRSTPPGRTGPASRSTG